jgi:hypothetical protein
MLYFLDVVLFIHHERVSCISLSLYDIENNSLPERLFVPACLEGSFVIFLVPQHRATKIRTFQFILN